MKRVSLVLILAMLPAAAVDPPQAAHDAEPAHISGIVRNGRTGDPLPGVQVAIEGTGVGAVTKADGTYELMNVPSGELRVRFVRMCFNPTTVEVRIDDSTPSRRVTLGLPVIYEMPSCLGRTAG